MREWLLTHVASDVPLVVLIILLAAATFVLWKAQQRADFDLANMLRDDSGKESPLRLCVLGAFAISSWAIMKDTLRTEGADPQLFLIYCATWSGALVFVRIADKWDGKLPWAKT
jgi:cbb3-type cytochrome oxidase subunit 3